MILPEDFETCPSGTHRILTEKDIQIQQLKADLALLMEATGVTEEELKEMRGLAA